MLVNRRINGRRSRKSRSGTAAVEFACSLPLLMLMLTGLFQIGRIVEMQQILYNGAREAARDASLGQDNLSAVATGLFTYIKAADQTNFGDGHSTAMIAPVVTLPANTYGYTCWDYTTNKELFTMTFTDVTNTSISDPSAMSQLDVYKIGVQVPYSSINLATPIPIAGTTRLYATVTWASLVDSPFAIAPNLPAQ